MMNNVWKHEINSHICPNCDYVFNACSSFEHDSVPSPGSVTICIKCAEPAVFTEDMQLRPPTEEEEIKIYTNPEVQELIRGIRSLN